MMEHETTPPSVAASHMANHPPPAAPVDVFLHRDGLQQGPLPLEEVRRLLTTGEITADTLAWKPGDAEWQPVGLLIGALSQVQPAPVLRNSGLGIASFSIGVAGFFGWFLLLGAAGILAMSGADDTSPSMMLVGLLLFLGVGLNFLGVIFGIIGIMSKNSKKTLSVIGTSLNGMELLIVAVLVILGLNAG